MSISLVFKPFGGEAEFSEAQNVASNITVNSGQLTENIPREPLVGTRQEVAGYVADSVQVVEKPFTPEHARRLNQYLLRHAENSVTGGRSGLMPLARVASYTITEN